MISCLYKYGSVEAKDSLAEATYAPLIFTAEWLCMCRDDPATTNNSLAITRP